MAIAYFYTWTTYGTWLPGDSRGWIQRGSGTQPVDRVKEFQAKLTMPESSLTLDLVQREIVEATLIEHCQIRNWNLIALNCRSNHVHVVIGADQLIPIKKPRMQFKAWCTRKLKASSTLPRENWWTERGWDEFIDDEDSLNAVIEYICFRQ